MAFLSNLPSYGNLVRSATVQGHLRTYIPYGDTDPPEDQVVKTDPTNILIRSLALKNKEERRAKESRGGSETGKGKRVAESTPEQRPAAKRLDVRSADTTDGGAQSFASVRAEDLNNMTVDKLKLFLKSKGLPVKGKKEELLARAKRALGSTS
eukprot:TRINITY_DN1338_c0_g1_i3.p1 TRINITY_DN1338_c0_g1~~TRINITY_DN1338_c0_g1_i3.p1  ORF type:complete len:153 (+),score=34.06 TRINITY_DN1338_c0_g1_i3:208-666(+)